CKGRAAHAVRKRARVLTRMWPSCADLMRSPAVRSRRRSGYETCRWSKAGGHVMLGSSNAVANVAVKNLSTAKKFYEGTLGLTKVDEEGDELVVFRSGDSLINVYRSEFAGTNKA